MTDTNVLSLEIRANFNERSSHRVGDTLFEVVHPFGPVSLRQRKHLIDGVVVDRAAFASRLYAAQKVFGAIAASRNSTDGAKETLG